MSVFRQALAQAQRGHGSQPRRWLFVAYDQLSDRLGPLARQPAPELGIVLVESRAKANRRPYHRQKLALLLSNLRHFALEQASRGVAVEHLVGAGGYAEILAPAIARHRGLAMQEAAERELREELAPLVGNGGLTLLPHEGWLTSDDQFRESQGRGPPFRMDAFYRRVRADTGLLMDGKKPRGGKWSHDADNRQPWAGKPPAAELPPAAIDAVTEEVIGLVERDFASHPGQVDRRHLYARAEDIAALWDWVKNRSLPNFGPYEDAMSLRSRTVFHSRLAALLNLHRLLPRQLVEEAAALPLPLPSQEGFIRQILGWREFVRHVHRATDGFRTLTPQSPGDPPGEPRGQPLPPAYWGKPSGLNCLDTVVRSVWEEGYSHHITRLMVLGNIATLLDLAPRELSDWFWVAYADAYDWVVEPNVLGMATFGYGPVMVTKPYVSGAAYLDRMSDYCGGCRFDPKRNCPLTRLYWAYLDRHSAALARVPRLSVPLAALRKRSAEQRKADATTFAQVSQALADGDPVSP